MAGLFPVIHLGQTGLTMNWASLRADPFFLQVFSLIHLTSSAHFADPGPQIMGFVTPPKKEFGESVNTAF